VDWFVLDGEFVDWFVLDGQLLDLRLSSRY
jgi:hypothetical protein